MKLKINLTQLQKYSQNIDEDFIVFLCKIVKENVVYTINNNIWLINKFDTYLKNNDIQIDIKKIISDSVNYIIYGKSNIDTYVIQIDENIKIGDYKLYSLCKLINYGNKSIQGTYIYSQAFDYVKEHFIVLLDLYQMSR